MKRLIFALLALPIIYSCSSYKMVGSINMISTRNVESKTDYVLLKTETDVSKKGLGRNNANTLDQAVNNTVSEVPGGEFLKNVKIYQNGSKWAIKGDVWGNSESANVEGFKIGDKVMIKTALISTGRLTGKEKYTKATITGFKDKKSCLVKFESGEIKEADYSSLSKAGE